jgi:hypothetical protein
VIDYAALTTRSDLMHRVQARIRFFFPSTMAWTRWMFGARTRRVWRFEWLTVFPVAGLLPQTSQTLDMFV